VRSGTKLALLAWALFSAGPGLAGSIVPSSRPDPLLDGGPTAPCAAGADYAAGIDVNGQPVVPANAAARPVPVPDSIAVPIGQNRARPGQGNRPGTDNAANTASGRDSAYVALDGRQLDPLINPPPCGAVR